jgi:hypothetical protein
LVLSGLQIRETNSDPGNSPFGRRALRRVADYVGARRLPAWPYFFLLTVVLLFYRTALFRHGWTFPWDFRGYTFPSAFLTVRALREGEWALWNPYIYCGHPLGANVQAAIFYPPRVLTFIMASLVGSKHLLYIMQWELTLHVYAAGALTYWCGRRWGLNRVAAVMSATVFALGGYFSSQTEHLGAVETATWLPLIVGSLASLRRRMPLRSVLLMSGALSMALLAGFTPLLLVLYLALAGFALLLILCRISSPRLLWAVAGAIVFSWLLSAIVLLPAVQLAGLSVGRFRADWRGTGGGIPAVSLITLVWPNLFHILEQGRYSGPYEITFTYLYSGLLALGLSAAACARIREARRLAFALLLLVSGFAMLGDASPAGKELFLLLPAQIRGPLYPAHWLAVFVLALALLAGFGLSQFRARPRLCMAAVLAAALELIAVSSGRPFNIQSVTADPGVTPEAFEGNAALMALVRGATSGTLPPSRIDTYGDSMNWVESATVTGVPTSGGYDPLALVRYMQVRLSMAPGERWGAYYEVVRPASPVLDFFNVRCLVSRAPIRPEVLKATGFRLAAEIDGHLLYENARCLPRFFFVPHALPVRSPAEALDVIRRPSWLPSDEAAVEASSRVLPPPNGVGSVRVLSYRMNSVELSVDAAAPALLASSEVHYPGWEARLDGQEAPIYFCNGAFRSIVVPSGKHIVQFRYRPPALIAGALVSSVAWLAFVFLWNRPKDRERLSRHPV